jgi:hypothetical protein
MLLTQPTELCADPVFGREDPPLNKSFHVTLAVIVLAAVTGSLVPESFGETSSDYVDCISNA